MRKAEDAVGKGKIDARYRNNVERFDRLEADPFCRDVARLERTARQKVDRALRPSDVGLAANREEVAAARETGLLGTQAGVPATDRLVGVGDREEHRPQRIWGSKDRTDGPVSCRQLITWLEPADVARVRAVEEHGFLARRGLEPLMNGARDRVGRLRKPQRIAWVRDQPIGAAICERHRSNLVQPDSSSTSRRSALTRSSPLSTRPPGVSQPLRATRTRRTRPAVSVTKPATATMWRGVSPTIQSHECSAGGRLPHAGGDDSRMPEGCLA